MAGEGPLRRNNFSAENMVALYTSLLSILFPIYLWWDNPNALMTGDMAGIIFRYKVLTIFKFGINLRLDHRDWFEKRNKCLAVNDENKIKFGLFY